MNGRKRHLLVDTLGLALRVTIHAANVADRDGAPLVLDGLAQTHPRLSHLWTDAGYRGPHLRRWLAQQPWTVTTVTRASCWQWVAPGEAPPPLSSGFEVLPRRWVVERTLAWLGRWRRLSKDYEGLPETSAAWCYLALSRVMSRRAAGLSRPEQRADHRHASLSSGTA